MKTKISITVLGIMLSLLTANYLSDETIDNCISPNDNHPTSTGYCNNKSDNPVFLIYWCESTAGGQAQAKDCIGNKPQPF